MDIKKYLGEEATLVIADRLPKTWNLWPDDIEEVEVDEGDTSISISFPTPANILEQYQNIKVGDNISSPFLNEIFADLFGGVEITIPITLSNTEYNLYAGMLSIGVEIMLVVLTEESFGISIESTIPNPSDENLSIYKKIPWDSSSRKASFTIDNYSQATAAGSVSRYVVGLCDENDNLVDGCWFRVLVDGVARINYIQGWQLIELGAGTHTIDIDLNTPSYNPTQSYKVANVIVYAYNGKDNTLAPLSGAIANLSLDLKDLEDKVNIEVITATGETLTTAVSRYYRFDEVVNTLNIKLPTITETNKVSNIVIAFTTGDAPAISITSDNKDISYFSGYSIEPNTTYELNIMFNGLKWIVAYGVVG